MFQKSLVLLVVGALFTTLAPPASAMSAPDAWGAQVRAALMKLGTGPSTQIVVTLRNKQDVTGYLDRVGDHSFCVTDPETQVTTQIAYGSVRQVNASLSHGAKVVITAGLIVGVVLLVSILRDWSTNQ